MQGTAQGGDDVLNGGAGDDILYGDAEEMSEDTIGGHDMLNGGAGNDQLYGNSGDDILHGGADADFVSGDAGNDLAFGDAGDDMLHGGDGDDQLRGGSGNDVLHGGHGSDDLHGGRGNDEFVIEDFYGAGMDTILDFTCGDRITIDTRGFVMDLDTNDDGVLDASDAQVNVTAGSMTIDLAPGAWLTVLDVASLDIAPITDPGTEGYWLT